MLIEAGDLIYWKQYGLNFGSLYLVVRESFFDYIYKSPAGIYLDVLLISEDELYEKAYVDYDSIINLSR